MHSIINVKGAVQGVGYRPFILQKATEYGIKGYVKNLGASVEILAIGERKDVLSFAELLENEAPIGSIILKIEYKEISPDEPEYAGYFLDDYLSEFKIIGSNELDLSKELPVFLPDIGICKKCTTEMLDYKDRRFRYPLISCASCGPRISILNKLPYDRDTTTMDEFKMCSKCAYEYKNGRRTYAQTISCHDCGPQMQLELCDGFRLDKHSFFNAEYSNIENVIYQDDAVKIACELLKEGKVIGLKGVSGYQLIGKPVQKTAEKIRQIKGRESKPFAVMFSDVEAVREYCRVNKKEEELLESSPRPIVLLTSKKDFDYEVCKDSRYIGAFLPSSGIHRLLTDAVGPLIVTSANISNEPIIIDDKEFKDKFLDADKAIGILYHKRKINIPQDDSVVFVTETDNDKYKTSYIRRSRGYVPLPVLLDFTDIKDSISQKGGGKSTGSVLAFGGDLKNTFAFGKNDRVIPSPYIGDLKDYETFQNEKFLINRFCNIYSFNPEVLVCDLHPLYQSTAAAKDMSEKLHIPLYEVQHHHAHILSVMAEKSIDSCIGIALDGTGYGTDKKIWGGEFLVCKGTDFERRAHLKYLKLCGGDNAPKNARQVRECYEHALNFEISNIVKAALDNNIGCFITSSTGRLFDAVSSLLDIKHENSFEGECASLLEAKAWSFEEQSDSVYPQLKMKYYTEAGEYILDQLALFKDIKELVDNKQFDKESISYGFHMAFAKSLKEICIAIRNDVGENKVCLSGGVFANRLLLRETIKELSNEDFTVYTNELVPAGDAGISLGQAYYGILKDGRNI